MNVRIGNHNDIDFLVNSAIKMKFESENILTSEAKVRAGVEKILADSHRGFYLVATADNKPIASLHIGYQWLDLAGGVYWWIQCVYVLPEFRRRGVYQMMYEYAKKIAAADSDIQGFRLCVHPQNKPARRAYETLGMKELAFVMYQE